MTPVAAVVSELLMMVLSVLAVPTDMKEFRLDVVNHSGHVETLLVKRTDEGFTVYDQREERVTEWGTIRPAGSKKDVYLFKQGNAPEQTLDIAASIKSLSLEGLRKATKLDLKASDGVVIHVARSGVVVYLTPEKGQATYACH